MQKGISMVQRDYRNKRLLYHFTALDNLESILEQGLLPRRDVRGFRDVADPEILANRALHGLDEMVPFHFFCDNPFDGRVYINHPRTDFIYITVLRDYARENGWTISPRHPLNGNFNLLDYDEGMEAINWDLMGQRNYRDDECRSVCMAECLSPIVVSPAHFSQIYVATEDVKESVEALLRDFNIRIYVTVNERMFPRRR